MQREILSPQRKMRMLGLRIVAGTLAAVVPELSVEVTANTFTAVAHGFITGDRVVGTTATTLPTGLSLATSYWVIKISADVFKLATTLANAVAATPTAIDVSDDGTGAHTFTMITKLAGPDKLQATMVDQAIGHWKITFLDPFTKADFTAVASSATVDQAAQVIARAVNYIEVKLSDIDETAALVDGPLDILVVGSDDTAYYGRS